MEKDRKLTEQEYKEIANDEAGLHYCKLLYEDRNKLFSELKRLLPNLGWYVEVSHAASTMYVYDLMLARAYAKQTNQYAESDKIRNDLIDLNIVISDNKDKSMSWFICPYDLWITWQTGHINPFYTLKTNKRHPAVIKQAILEHAEEIGDLKQAVKDYSEVIDGRLLSNNRCNNHIIKNWPIDYDSIKKEDYDKLSNEEKYDYFICQWMPKYLNWRDFV